LLIRARVFGTQEDFLEIPNSEQSQHHQKIGVHDEVLVSNETVEAYGRPAERRTRKSKPVGNTPSFQILAVARRTGDCIGQ